MTDVDIVKAIAERSHHCTTTLISEDTDLLTETLGNDLCNKLLFVHAYSGFNSTSRIFDKNY